MSAIILRNEIVHYEVLGRGRPLVFLHGWIGSWRYWIPSMQTASVSFRAYAIDLWGFGDTAKNPNRYLLSEQMNLLDKFMDEMGIGKIALIGHGLGAIIALMYAEQHPRYVDRVMAISTPLSDGLINPRMRQDSPTELAEWLVGNNPDAESIRLEAPKTDQDAILRSLHNLDAISLNNLPERLTTPCLLVHGVNDLAIEVPQRDRLSTLPNHIHHIKLNTSGHFPMIDQPNKFNRLVTDFLTLESGESPRQLQLKEEWKRRIR
jgi:pimeloyl-ACP methyl ester carboxylesterase